MAEIRIIGPKGSGKTTYLAALAAYPHKERLSGLDVIPVGPDAEMLENIAKDQLRRSDRVGLTQAKGDPDREPVYELVIELPARKHPIRLLAKDYAGEIFEDIPLAYKWDKVGPYIEDLFGTVRGWMVMLTDWQPERDGSLYRPVFKRLWDEITLREEEEIEPPGKRLRIAVVMTKCERGEIWSGRLDPDEDLFQVRLPKTYHFITSRIPSYRLKFFACSSFGVLDGRYDPRPNRYVIDQENVAEEENPGEVKLISGSDDAYKAEFNTVLRDPDVWQPYGLIAPIYWLSTGRTLHDQRL